MAASVWKGHITFGLITIPVRLLRAARSERVPLRELYPTKEVASLDDRGVSLPAAPSAAPSPIRIDRKRVVADAPPPPEPISSR
jgi:hypothetical protein